MGGWSSLLRVKAEGSFVIEKKVAGESRRDYPRAVARARRTAPGVMSAGFGMHLRSVQRDGVRSQNSPLAGNLPAGDRGPYAGEADPTCAPCEVPATKEAGRGDEREGAFECNICLDVATDPVVTQCGHLYCWPCIYKYVRRAREAPDPPTGSHLISRGPFSSTKIGGFSALLRPPDRPTARPPDRIAPSGSRTPPSTRARSHPNPADRSPRPI